MAFRIGMRVCCVNLINDTEFSPPPVGSISEVSNVFVTDKGVLNIELAEFPAPESDEYFAGWAARHFRPVVNRNASIEIFERMLTPSPALVKDLCGNE